MVNRIGCVAAKRERRAGPDNAITVAAREEEVLFPDQILKTPGKLRRLGARLGWRVGGLYLCHRVVQAMTGGWAEVQCYFLVRQPVQERPLLPDHLRGGVSVRLLTSADPEISAALSRVEELDTRLRRGDTCLAGFHDGRVVGYLWLCYAAFEDDETHCRFVPRDGAGGAWDFDLSVAPAHRGGAVFAALWDAAWDVLRQKGYDWTASRVSAFNDLSLRSHRRIGAAAVGTLLVLRAGRGAAVFSSIGPAFRLAGRRSAPATVFIGRGERRPER